MGELRMPSLGADMEDGRLVEWEKRPGDAVARGEVIAVVETQKGAIEIEAHEDGVLESILVETGTSVPVGTPIARIGAAGGGAGEAIGAIGADEGIEPPPARPPERSVPVKTKTTRDPSRPRISPAARRRAAAAGLATDRLVGHGPDGAITLADVERAIAASESASGEAEDDATRRRPGPSAPTRDTDAAASPASLPSGMREAIGAAMTRSKREIPHYYLAHSADLTAAAAWLAHRNADRPPDERVPMATLFVAAVARAARRHPRFNGHWTDGAFRPAERVHVGMAIRLRGRGPDGGLVAPALHDADRDAPETLSERLVDLVGRVRAGRFRLAELSDPTLTVSSVGERGVETLYGVIHPPQVCLVGFGAPRPAARVRDGALVVAPSVAITLAADHRVSDGHAGSRFLADIARGLEAPDTLASVA